VNQKKKQILSITSASGWHARYKQEDGSTHLSPIACWALIEEQDGERYVVGLDGPEYLDFCDENSNFDGYIFGGTAEPVAPPRSGIASPSI